MAHRLRLFVSAGPDLDLEREYIGQALARFPASLGWTIQYTPGSHDTRPPDSQAILSAHFHVLLLGRDITAPVGWELWTAHTVGKDTIAFAKNVNRTPAAMVFYREARVIWRTFDEPAELVSSLQEVLAQRLIQDPSRYGLTLAEWETLSAFLKDLGEQPDEAGDEALSGGGAGGGGVILSPGRDLPTGGVLIGGERGEGDVREGDDAFVGDNPHGRSG